MRPDAWRATHWHTLQRVRRARCPHLQRTTHRTTIGTTQSCCCARGPSHGRRRATPPRRTQPLCVRAHHEREHLLPLTDVHGGLHTPQQRSLSTALARVEGATTYVALHFRGARECCRPVPSGHRRQRAQALAQPRVRPRGVVALLPVPRALVPQTAGARRISRSHREVSQVLTQVCGRRPAQ